MGRKRLIILSKIHQTGPLVRRFARNPLGRDLIVGDVHGHFTRLQAALDAVAFDPTRDRLFSVGDLVDRGPESDQALDWLARPWFHAVSGNHEDYAIRWPLGFMFAGHYVANGGAWNVSNPPDAQREFAAAFAALPIAIELETVAGLVGIIHADVPGVSWPAFVEAIESPALSSIARERLIDRAQWSRDRIDKMIREDVAGVFAVVVGHTPVEAPTTLGNVHFIDTGGWRGERGHFTLLDAHTLRAAEPPSSLRW